MSHKGKIILILSCMFAGKTESLLAYARKYSLAKKKVILIKYSKDTRYSVDEICSHNKTSMKATFSCESLAPLIEEKDIDDADVILIDEGQFFEDSPIICNLWANQGKIIVISALNGDFEQKPFPVISELIAIAEERVNLSAVCVICGEDANFTKRKIISKAKVLIGGENIYEARCRECLPKN